MVMSVNSQRSHKRILTQNEKSYTQSHQRKNSADMGSRPLEINCHRAQKVMRKTEHGTSRHNNNKVDGVH